ncbi:MAG: hypothetical protein HZA46_09870 [Planctomycetales bacterium]|nr:hypothetical protein [Planctomycetales bacterium]
MKVSPHYKPSDAEWDRLSELFRRVEDDDPHGEIEMFLIAFAFPKSQWAYCRPVQHAIDFGAPRTWLLSNPYRAPDFFATICGPNPESSVQLTDRFTKVLKDAGELIRRAGYESPFEKQLGIKLVNPEWFWFAAMIDTLLPLWTDWDPPIPGSGVPGGDQDKSLLCDIFNSGQPFPDNPPQCNSFLRIKNAAGCAFKTIETLRQLFQPPSAPSTVENGTPPAEKPAGTARLKEPSREAFAAYRVHMLLGKNQTETAKTMTEKFHRPVS